MRVATGKAARSSEGQPNFNRRFYSLQFTCTTAYLVRRDERSGMSVDHSVVTARPDRDPLFLHVKAGMTVIVEENGDWWMGDVVFVEGGARNPKVPTLFQVANVDTGVIRWINADLEEVPSWGAFLLAPASPGSLPAIGLLLPVVVCLFHPYPDETD